MLLQKLFPLTRDESQEASSEQHFLLDCCDAREGRGHARHGQQLLHEAHVSLEQKELVELVGVAVGGPGPANKAKANTTCKNC